MATELSYEDALKTSPPAEIPYEQAAGLPPAKPRGMISAFGAGMKETFGQAAQAAGKVSGISTAEQFGKEVRAGAAPTEEESMGVSVARAAGGLAAWLPAIAGTTALLPEAGVGLLGGAAIRGAIGMALPAATSKVVTTTDLREKGVDDATAEKAGWASAATTTLAGALPLSMSGTLGKRLLTGIPAGVATGEMSRGAQNAILSDHPELQQATTVKDVVVDGVVSGMLAGVLGPRPIKTSIKDATKQAEADIANGELTPGAVRMDAQAVLDERNRRRGVVADQERAAGKADAEARHAQWVKGIDQNGRETRRDSDIESTDAPEAAPAPEVKPDMSALSAEANRRTAAAAQDGFARFSELTDFAASERVDVEAQRAQLLAGQEATRQQWRATKLASDIESTDARVEGVRLKQQQTDRQALMDTIYSNPAERTPGMSFLDALAKEYPNEPNPIPREKKVMSERESAYQAFTKTDVAPSTPNELPAGLVPEVAVKPAAGKQAGVVGDRARGVKDVTNMWEAVLTANPEAASSLKAQHIAKVVKDKTTITEQLAAIAELRKKPSTGTDNKVLLDQLAEKLGKFKKEAPSAIPIESPAGEVPRDVTTGRDSTQGGEGVRPVEQGAQVAPEGKQGNATSAQKGEVTYEEATQAVTTEAKQPEAIAGETPYERVARLQAETLAKMAAPEVAPVTEPRLGENIPPDQAPRRARVEALMDEARRLADEGDVEGAHRTERRANLEIIEGGPEYQQHLIDEQSNKAGEAFASKTVEQAQNPATKEQINTEAAKIFGSTEAVDRLVVHVTDPETQIPKRALDDLRKMEEKEGRAITVAFAHDGKIYVMDKQVEAGTERAIIMHEAGVHLGMEKLIGKDNFGKLVNQIQEWANGNGHIDDIALAQKAMMSVRKGGVPERQIDQETVAYFVQHAIEAGIDPTQLKGQAQSEAIKWLRKIWATMRSALQKLGIDPSQLRAQDVVDIAHAAAVAHAEAIPGERAETRDFMSKPEVLRAVRLGFSTPESAARTTDAVLSTATKLWDGLKPVLQRAHLNWSQMTHIADMTENLIPKLAQWGADAVNPVRDKVNSMLASGAIAKELNHAAQGIYDQMQALPPKQRDALGALMGKYQLAKVYPNLPAEAHTWLKPEEKALYREAKQLYSQPGVAAAYDAARLHNQRLHDTGMASMLKSMGQIYGVPEPLWRAIDVRKGMGKEVDALLAHVKASDDHNLQDQFSTAMGLHEAKKTESYFSLGRDGDYMVNFRVKDTPEAHAAVQKALSAAGVKDSIVVNPGDTHVFSMFDTMNQMLAVTKQLDSIKEHLEPKEGVDSTGKPTYSPYTAGLAVEKLKSLDSSAPSFIRGMLAKIDADAHLNPEQKAEQQELLRRMYINMLPESSVSKFYARRAGVPGYSSDMARSFVKRAAAGAYFTSQHATRPEQAVAMSRLREATTEMGDAGSAYFDLKKQAATVNVINELNKRTANMLTPLHTPALDTMSAISHAFYLSASPGFILQNLAQPYQLTLPYLGGRHGFRASSVAMGSAASDVAKIIKDTIQQGWQGNKWTGVLDATITVDRATHLSKGDQAALRHLIASGRADWTQGGELTKIAEGSNRSLETALKTANSLSYYGEVLNRMQTGLAAYRLEMKRSNDTAKAMDYMVRAVDDTQINYATENRARAIGKHGIFGQVTPLAMAFQQFSLGVLQLLGKLTLQATRSGAPAAERAEAVKSLAGIMAATGVSAGTLGLPFAGVVMGAYNALAGDENHQVDAKADYQNFLTNIMGQDAAQVVAHGAMNYMTGADVASKLGQANVIPFTDLFSQLMDSRRPLKDRIDAGALNLMGPVVAGGANVVQGLSMLADGDTMKGLEKMSPAATKSLIKAVDITSNGFTDSKGIKLPMEATAWDTTIQAFGFTPTKKATQQEAQQAVNAMQSARKMREHDLTSRFVAAAEAHDPVARMQVMDEAREFLRANPGVKLDFAGAMRRRAQEAAIARATGSGVRGTLKQISAIRQQTEFAQQP